MSCCLRIPNFPMNLCLLLENRVEPSLAIFSVPAVWVMLRGIDTGGLVSPGTPFLIPQKNAGMSQETDVNSNTPFFLIASEFTYLPFLKPSSVNSGMEFPQVNGEGCLRAE